MQSKNLNLQYEKINEQKYFCFCVSAILRSPRMLLTRMSKYYTVVNWVRFRGICVESSEHAITVLNTPKQEPMTSHEPLLKDNLPWNVNSWQAGLCQVVVLSQYPKKSHNFLWGHTLGLYERTFQFVLNLLNRVTEGPKAFCMWYLRAMIVSVAHSWFLWQLRDYFQ